MSEPRRWRAPGCAARPPAAADRRLRPSPGLLLPAVFGVCVPSVGSSVQSLMVFLVLASATTSFCSVGQIINPLDLAPR